VRLKRLSIFGPYFVQFIIKLHCERALSRKKRTADKGVQASSKHPPVGASALPCDVIGSGSLIPDNDAFNSAMEGENKS